jgi:retron-type reverse transcriptase
VGKSNPKDKSFDISKRLVWEAYKSVKANQGAAGVDGQSVEAFEADLRNNLYKIWNRMSSGTYFPPPVRAVEIPKPHGGGTRVLGCSHRRRQNRSDSGGAAAVAAYGVDLS